MAGVAIVNVAPISVSGSASKSTRLILVFMSILCALVRNLALADGNAIIAGLLCDAEWCGAQSK
jgi:hypothetical protein